MASNKKKGGGWEKGRANAKDASGAAPTRANAEQHVGVAVAADNAAAAQANMAAILETVTQSAAAQEATTAAILAAIGQLGNRMGEKEQRLSSSLSSLATA